MANGAQLPVQNGKDPRLGGREEGGGREGGGRREGGERIEGGGRERGGWEGGRERREGGTMAVDDVEVGESEIRVPQWGET